jgi:hypothetical protein
MDNMKIEMDFIPGFLQAERKNKKKMEDSQNGFFPDQIDQEGGNFVDNLVKKISKDEPKTKKSNSSVASLNILLNKEKQNLTMVADNAAKTGFNNVTPEKLQESSQILDEILDTLNNKS